MKKKSIAAASRMEPALAHLMAVGPVHTFGHDHIRACTCRAPDAAFTSASSVGGKSSSILSYWLAGDTATVMLYCCVDFIRIRNLLNL